MLLQIGFVFLATLAFSITAWLARHSDRSGNQRVLFLLAWGAILLAYIGYACLSALGLQTLAQTDYSQITLDPDLLRQGAMGVVFAIVSAIYLWLVVASDRVRQLFARVLSRNAAQDGPTFNPASNIHTYALALVQLMFLQAMLDFIIAGGQEGLIINGINQNALVLSAMLTAIMFALVSFIGGGAAQGRSWRAMIDRLGLGCPTWVEALAGIGIACILLMFQYSAAITWSLFVSPETLQEQTQMSQAISGSVTAMWAAFLIAVFSSVGEEISFRGALQPILGLWATSIMFALSHIQYQLTPAALIILIVGAALGYTRRYFNTTVAIITHFSYNFALLSITVMFSGVLESLGPAKEALLFWLGAY